MSTRLLVFATFLALALPSISRAAEFQESTTWTVRMGVAGPFGRDEERGIAFSVSALRPIHASVEAGIDLTWHRLAEKPEGIDAMPFPPPNEQRTSALERHVAARSVTHVYLVMPTLRFQDRGGVVRPFLGFHGGLVLTELPREDAWGLGTSVTLGADLHTPWLGAPLEVEGRVVSAIHDPHSTHWWGLGIGARLP